MCPIPRKRFRSKERVGTTIRKKITRPVLEVCSMGLKGWRSEGVKEWRGRRFVQVSGRTKTIDNLSDCLSHSTRPLFIPIWSFQNNYPRLWNNLRLNLWMRRQSRQLLRPSNTSRWREKLERRASRGSCGRNGVVPLDQLDLSSPEATATSTDLAH